SPPAHRLATTPTATDQQPPPPESPSRAGSEGTARRPTALAVGRGPGASDASHNSRCPISGWCALPSAAERRSSHHLMIKHEEFNEDFLPSRRISKRPVSISPCGNVLSSLIASLSIRNFVI